ncbi:MAG: nitrate reductase [Methylothermaceae bacteria B42]|nr:MAG: nitrate reductase [Methylothermaceae bacteria B42]
MIATPPSCQTTCPYCGVGCGVQVTCTENQPLLIEGDPTHPANLGRLCSKGSALGETVELPGRLLYPQIGGRQTSWDEAITTVAEKFRQTIAKYGPESLAFYVSGQLLTEDYYVANKLMKGFIGSANIDTNSRLCMSTPVVAHQRAFGEDLVPACYADLEQAEMVVLAGSNLAWCHPVLFRRLNEAPVEQFVVTIDPRRTYTTSFGGLHLAIKPGTDAVLFNGLLVYLYDHNQQNENFVTLHTEGLKATIAAARASSPDIATVARICELNAEDVETFYRHFAATERVVSAYSQGLNQSTSGVNKINALINCHLITGRIGKPGAGPFSLTGQPNAMGGREVGGLSSQLAAHMALENEADRQRVQQFWQSPTIAEKPGFKATALFDAILEGKIKAIWIMATNPVVSLPDADHVRRALECCPLVVISECVQTTDTAVLADVLLPAATWGEKDGTVTNSARVISRQRTFRRPPGEAQPDWWIIAQVAKAMGYGNFFDYNSPAQIFREHAALSSVGNNGQRLFDISALASLSDEQYDALSPVPWPITQTSRKGVTRLFTDGYFPTDNGRARFVAVEPRLPARSPDDSRPLVLNTGRVRDQWHTMTRTGTSLRLSGHTPEPFVAVHPSDADKLALRHKELAWIRGHSGHEILARVHVSPRQRPGSVFVPMHWNDFYTSQGRVNTLLENLVDPLSGQPEFKHQPVSVLPCHCEWFGFYITRVELHPQLKYALYWARVRLGHELWRYEVAGNDEPKAWPARARELLEDEQGVWIEYHDSVRNQYRAAVLHEEKLAACVYISRDPQVPPRDWLIELFEREHLTKDERMSLLFGREGDEVIDDHTVCACFKVSEPKIRQAIKEGYQTVEEIGQILGAGQKCGSCLPELQELVSRK